MSSTLDPRIILHENSHRLGIELQRSSEVCETTLAEFTQIFVRAARRFFSGILQFFRASWAQNLRDPDAGRLFDSDLNAVLMQSTLSEVVQYL